MSTPSNPGWASGYVPTAAQWAAVFSGKVDYPAPVGQGGTGLTSTPAAGQILIGTGSGFALSAIVAGSGISVANGAGSVTISSTAGTSADAFNSYGLQWAIWFNAAPLSNEIMALYTSPINYQYPASFTSSVTNPPLINPSANFTLNVQQRLAGSGFWTTIGSILIRTDGTVTLSTVSSGATLIHVGDQLRVIAPSVVDASLSGFSCTLKGFIAV